MDHVGTNRRIPAAKYVDRGQYIFNDFRRRPSHVFDVESGVKDYTDRDVWVTEQSIMASIVRPLRQELS